MPEERNINEKKLTFSREHWESSGFGKAQHQTPENKGSKQETGKKKKSVRADLNSEPDFLTAALKSIKQ